MTVRESLIGSAIAAALAVTPANGEFVVVNNPLFDETGNYSDAFGTNGTTEYRTSWAQQFTLDQGYTLSSIRWWGGVNGFFGDGIQSITGFQVIVWNQDFTQQIHNINLSVGDYTMTDSGMDNFFGQDVYTFYTPVSLELNAGTYNMNIGAWYADAGVAHDQFVWSTGQHSSNGMPTYYTENASVYGVWGQWHEYIGGTFNAGGAMVLSAPTPGAIALLGFAGLVGGRRRR